MLLRVDNVDTFDNKESTQTQLRKNTMSEKKIPTFTRQEAAIRLGTSYRTVIRLEARGELKPCGRSGTEFLYPVVAVDALKAKREARFEPVPSQKILTVAQAKRRAGR